MESLECVTVFMEVDLVALVYKICCRAVVLRFISVIGLFAKK